MVKKSLVLAEGHWEGKNSHHQAGNQEHPLIIL